MIRADLRDSWIHVSICTALWLMLASPVDAQSDTRQDSNARQNSGTGQGSMTRQGRSTQTGSATRQGSATRRPNDPFGGSQTRQAPMRPRMTQPQSTNPFAPRATPSRPVPLACRGYCVVTLKLERQWLPGHPAATAVYRGRQYRFADARKRAIFAAAPGQYAPLMGGDCPVSLAEDQKRVEGNLLHGVEFRGRLVFFTTTERMRRFQASPAAFFETGLAAEQREYIPPPELDDPEPPVRQPSSPETPESEKESAVGLSGYCPVTLLVDGRWQQGSKELRVEHAGLSFLCADQNAYAAFSARPEQYLSPAGGYCPVTFARTGVAEPGYAEHTVEYPAENGRLYVFTSAAAKQEFIARPEQYALLDAAAGRLKAAARQTRPRIGGFERSAGTPLR